MTGAIKDLNQKKRGKEREIALFIVKHALWEQIYRIIYRTLIYRISIVVWPWYECIILIFHTKSE